MTAATAKMTMQIGELSMRTGATERMLRYYEQQGLLHPARTAAGYRVYADSDILRVRYIRCMLSSALPAGVVAQALAFLMDGSPQLPADPRERARLGDALQVELEALTERIAILEDSRARLTRLVQDVKDATLGPDRPGTDERNDWGPAVRGIEPGARRPRAGGLSGAA